MAKVTVLGAGNVGGTLAMLLAEDGLANIMLVDVVEGLPQGKALDITAALPLFRMNLKVEGSNDLADAEGSDVVVVTAGLPRRPGMSRDDLLAKNAEIVGGVADAVKKHAPGSVVICVTNPLDAMCYLLMKRTGFEAKRVMGMAGVLDSARLRAFLAAEAGVSPADVSATVLGGHGEGMVAVIGSATVGGVPVREVLSPEILSHIVERTRRAGAEVVGLLKTGSAFVSPAAGVREMVRAVLLDEKRVLPVSAWLEGQFGIEGVYLGVPAVLGRGGVEHVFEIKLAADEAAALRASAEKVRALQEKLPCA